MMRLEKEIQKKSYHNEGGRTCMSENRNCPHQPGKEPDINKM